MSSIRDRIKHSKRTDSGIGFVTSGIPVYATKAGPGETFLLQVAPQVLPRITGVQVAGYLTSEPLFRSQSGVIIGQFIGCGGGLLHHLLPEEGPRGGRQMTITVSEMTRCIPAVADLDLANFALAASEAFETRLSGMGTWESFGSYLLSALGHDAIQGSPSPALRPSFRWLMGPLAERAGLQPIAAYRDHGIYLRPDGLLPVYSSHLQGSLAGDLLAEQLGVELVPDGMKCLGCYLNGVSGELGPEVLRGAVLDDQWLLTLESCERHSPPGRPSVVSHVSLFDGQVEYTLTGCPGEGSFAHFAATSRLPEHDCARRPW